MRTHPYLLIILIISQISCRHYLEVRGKIKGDEEIHIPQYYILKTDDFLELSNIRFDVLLPAYEAIIDGQHIYEYGNKILLELLTAYDKSGGKKKVLLETAKDFSEWLMDKASQEALPYSIRLINKMQVIRRERNFTSAEKREVFALIEDDSSMEEIIVGANLLLGNQVGAEIHFEKLNPEFQETFKSFPIYYFWDKPQDESVDEQI